MFRIVKNKRLTILSLTSFLLISFCLIPCGEVGLLSADAGTHGDMHSGHGEAVETHSCHGSRVAYDEELRASDAELVCFHCDLSAPLALQDINPQIFKVKTAETSIDELHFYSVALLKSYFQNLGPPGLAEPIYLLNETYLI